MRRKELSGWETVQIARHPDRPRFHDYVKEGYGVFNDFMELHGDRHYGDDKAIVAGCARLGKEKVVLIGHSKGDRQIDGDIDARKTGSPMPEGFRKAMRVMNVWGEKFGRPIVTLIDTAGAYPDDNAEERGIAQAIAYNLRELSRLRTPIISLVIGEGGSGGALGIGVADHISMLENSYYSVITPEGCTAILTKNYFNYSPDLAAEELKLRAGDLKRLKLIDSTIPEYDGGAHLEIGDHYRTTMDSVREALSQRLKGLVRLKIDTLLKRRYKKWRNIGDYFKRECS